MKMAEQACRRTAKGAERLEKSIKIKVNKLVKNAKRYAQIEVRFLAAPRNCTEKFHHKQCQAERGKFNHRSRNWH